MIIIGTFIRGPGWQWFWPGQTWDHNRLIYEVNRDLPDIFGITSNLAKIIFGAIVVGGYYLAGGFLVHALFRRYKPEGSDFHQRMDEFAAVLDRHGVFAFDGGITHQDGAAIVVAYQVRVDYALVQRLVVSLRSFSGR